MLLVRLEGAVKGAAWCPGLVCCGRCLSELRIYLIFQVIKRSNGSRALCIICNLQNLHTKSNGKQRPCRMTRCWSDFWHRPSWRNYVLHRNYHWARGLRGIWFSENQPLAVTCSHSSDRKWPQVTAESKWPQVTASARKWPQVTAERPQVTAESKWPQVAASDRKWPQVVSIRICLPSSGCKWRMIAVVMENVQHFPAQLMENVRHSPGRQQYHREAFFQASYSKERGCTSKTRRRLSRKQRRQCMERIAEMSSVRSIETKPFCSRRT